MNISNNLAQKPNQASRRSSKYGPFSTPVLFLWA